MGIDDDVDDYLLSPEDSEEDRKAEDGFYIEFFALYSLRVVKAEPRIVRDVERLYSDRLDEQVKMRGSGVKPEDRPDIVPHALSSLRIDMERDYVRLRKLGEIPEGAFEKSTRRIQSIIQELRIGELHIDMEYALVETFWTYFSNRRG